MGLLDTLSKYGDMASSVIDNPITQLGIGYYQNRQNKDAINNATAYQTNANTSASNRLSKFYGRAMGELRGAYGEGRTSLAPYYAAGTDAMGRYSNLVQDPSSLAERGDYQFGLNQGLEAVDRRMGSNRMLNSGNRAIALNEYGQNYANQFLDNALARETTLMNAGQNATNTLANMGYNYSSGLSNLLGTQGQQQANLDISKGDIYATGEYAGAQNRRNLFSDILSASDWWSTSKKS